MSGNRAIAMLRNTRIGIVALLLPLAVFLLAVYLIASKVIDAISERREQEAQAPVIEAQSRAAWNSLSAFYEQRRFEPVRQFAYYRVLPNETAGTLSRHFSVPVATLAAMNPGPIVPGRTIRVPPLEGPMNELPLTPLNAETITVTEAQGVVSVVSTESTKVVTIPALAALLQDRGVLTEVAPRRWRLEKSLFLNKDIRLDITDQSIDVLELRSEPGFMTGLIGRRSEILIKNVSITSFDPGENDVDRDFEDGRSFIRAAENSRMDIVNSDMGYLGCPLIGLEDLIPGGPSPPYGVAWRNPLGSMGTSIVTGWVQGSRFHHNYFSDMNYMLDNDISGGGNGIYVYDNTSNSYMRGNAVLSEGIVLRAKQSVSNMLFAENRVEKLDFRFDDPTNTGLFVGFNEVVAEE